MATPPITQYFRVEAGTLDGIRGAPSTMHPLSAPARCAILGEDPALTPETINMATHITDHRVPGSFTGRQ